MCVIISCVCFIASFIYYLWVDDFNYWEILHIYIYNINVLQFPLFIPRFSHRNMSKKPRCSFSFRSSPLMVLLLQLVTSLLATTGEISVAVFVRIPNVAITMIVYTCEPSLSAHRHFHIHTSAFCVPELIRLRDTRQADHAVKWWGFQN